MKSRFYGLLITGISLLFAMCLWRNKVAYKDKNLSWNALKSLVETVIISLCAWKFPAILVGWCTIWVTRPCKTPVYRVVIGVLAGGLFGLCEMYGIFELICVISVFAIDLVTGKQGFLRRKKELEMDYAV